MIRDKRYCDSSDFSRVIWDGKKERVTTNENRSQYITVRKDEYYNLVCQSNDNEKAIRLLIAENKNLASEIERLKKDKTIAFKKNDVYEVNKRIERLEASVKYIASLLENNWLLKLLRIV